ncbi:MFS transporter, DHA1 family, multidrug resistance protein [Arboricoccus pini]|uniref:MFS transporter, DHA1 family, multidrug resistance protein n=1 Tax=Arboricoccus pini TaxID=1963835 RepID=A0A212RN50_9PROT|nr:MFS transporter [Arboricoccus pini]SNB73957.1 MFS transporter, DHA1 family, multidrug resistance protein [Arboricoccus pini]
MVRARENEPAGWTPLLSVVLLMTVGTFMAQPFIMVTLADVKHLSSVQAGSVMATLLIVQQAAPLLVGGLGERFGYRRLIMLGLLLRALGYGSLALTGSLPALLAAAALAGLGGAFYHTLIGAFFIDRPGEARRVAVTWLNQLANLGAILGPLLGSLLIQRGSTCVLLVAAAILILGAILLASVTNFADQAERPPRRQGLLIVLRDHRFLAFSLIMTSFWILFTQLSVAFPLAATAVGGQAAAGYVWLVNGGSCFVAMFALRSIFKSLRPGALIRLGLLVMASGMALMPLLPAGLFWTFSCVVVCAIGETMILPAVDLALGDYSDSSGQRGSYYGVYELSFALGGGIGSLLGSTFLLTGDGPELWAILAAIGLVGALALRVGDRRLSPARA